MRYFLSFALFATLCGTGLAAQDVAAFEADTAAQARIEQLRQNFSQGCSSGNVAACRAMSDLQNFSTYLSQMSAACQRGEQSGCRAYQAFLPQLNGRHLAYVESFVQMQAGRMAQLNTDHQRRMEEIEAWGALMLRNGEVNSDLLDRNHEAYINSIWE